MAKVLGAIVWADILVAELKIPSLSKFGLSGNDFPELVKNAKIPAE